MRLHQYHKINVFKQLFFFRIFEKNFWEWKKIFFYYSSKSQFSCSLNVTALPVPILESSRSLLQSWGSVQLRLRIWSSATVSKYLKVYFSKPQNSTLLNKYQVNPISWLKKLEAESVFAQILVFWSTYSNFDISKLSEEILSHTHTPT